MTRYTKPPRGSLPEPPIELPEVLRTPLDRALFLEDGRAARAALKKNRLELARVFPTLKFPRAPRKP